MLTTDGVTVRPGRDGHSVGSIVYIGWNLPKTLERDSACGIHVGMTIRAEVAQAELSLVERPDVRWPLPPETSSCRAPGLAFAVQARAGAGGGALRGVAVGGGGFPRPGGFAEVAARHLPEEAGSGRRGDEGSPPRGERRPIVEGGSGASGEAPVGSQGQVGRGPLGRVAVGGSRPAAQGGGPADQGSRPAGGPAGPGGAGVGDRQGDHQVGRAARSLGSMRS